MLIDQTNSRRSVAGTAENLSFGLIHMSDAELADGPTGPAAFLYVPEPTWSDILVNGRPCTSAMINDGSPSELRSLGLDKTSSSWTINWQDIRADTGIDIYVPRLTGIYDSPAKSRRWHNILRDATSYEQCSLERRLEDETRSLSNATLTDILKLLRGRPLRQSVGAHVVRERSLLSELRALIKRVARVAPMGAITRRGADRVLEAIRSARRHARKVRPAPPRQTTVFAGSIAASSKLDSEIMRHGPPLSPRRRRIWPGAG